MKKRYIYIALAALTISTSCKKELNQVPISNPVAATFYQSAADFYQAMNAVYGDLHNYPVRLADLSEIRSDNIYGVSVTVRDWDPVNDFSPALASNAYVLEAWESNFNGIFRANTMLSQLSTNGSYLNSTTAVTQYTAETRFLRAFCYFDLVRYFGKVPIIDHVVTADEATTIGRSPVADVYKLIISDLQYAVANLPATYTGTDVGRASKYAAEALLAEVYMARSGATYGIEGPGLGLSEWSLALPLLNDVINSGQFTFNTNYANIFSYSNQNPSVNKEAIFDVMYQSGISGSSDLYGASFPWILVPNGYFSTLKDTKSNGSLEIIPVSNDMVSSYATADVRKTQSVYTAGYTATNGSVELRPFFKKWLDITKIPTTTRFDWGIDYIAIRYTDVLMLKAECILRGGGGSTSDALAIVNQVRARAGLTALASVTIDQLYDERRREFADEGLRWFDLQRSGNLVTIMNAWIAKEDTQKAIQQVTANYVIYPVPQRELDAAPGLFTQNPGYR